MHSFLCELNVYSEYCLQINTNSIQSFPIQEVRRWPLDTVTLQMRATKTKYRWVISPWVDQGDLEAAVTLQIWRELESLHHHTATVGELPVLTAQ